MTALTKRTERTVETESDPREKPYTASQAAAYLETTRATLAKWRSTGAGPKFFSIGEKPNSPVRYRKGDLDDWVEARIKISTAKGA